VTDPGGVVQRVRLAAYAWIEAGDRVLLSRIAAGTPGAGRWTLPGGELHFGEDPSEGVVREIAEETGLDARVGDLVAIRSIVLEPEQTVRGDRLQAVGILYRATVLDGELRPETDGSTDLAAWVPFAELDDLPTVRLLDWARSVIGR
jgi:ADP-ribose pyrophosphatase YjhB (NUDIX family)